MGSGAIWQQAAAGAATSALGIGFQRIGARYDRRQQIATQEELTEVQKRAEKEMMDYQQQKELEMWEKTGYGAQMEQLAKAGLNPGLIYGMGGGGGQTIGHGGSPSITGGTAQYQNTTSMGIQAGMQLAAQAANIELIKAQTEKTNVEATKIAGPDTQQTLADTELKVLDKVIKEYTGKELKSQFERVVEPNRGIAMKTLTDELSARQGVAGTIYEMWVEGKLKDKSVAELESLLLSNAKTREETKQIVTNMDLLEENIKGAKLDNIMKDLESRLQTETGIDRNSPAWMKIIGRLFIQLFNK